jgi:hypothetical protein
MKLFRLQAWWISCRVEEESSNDEELAMREMPVIAEMADVRGARAIKRGRYLSEQNG